ncbi:MAG: branched-chain amino acid transporter AzlD [Lachnospiraceae bacterium]|nr:branched-chain amino acid transporter AzlD [Lachnospiraceae bacterium]
MDLTHSALIVAVVALVMAALRFAPFFVFNSEETPPIIAYLSRVLPCAIMGMLVIYCLKGVSLVTFPHGIPEAIAIVFVALSYVWKRNTLASIALGTVLYMVLVQVVF